MNLPTHTDAAKRFTRCALSAVTLAVLTACSTSPTSVSAPDAIYSGGDILTMEGKSPKYVRRLAVERAI